MPPNLGTAIEMNGRSGRAGRLKRLVCASFYFFLAGIVAATTAQADRVKGDATLTPSAGYARIVLTFEQGVPTEVATSGAILIVRFKQPVDMPVDKLSDAAPAYVGSARRDPDGMAIRLALAQQVKINLMTAGERVFIDLLPEKWTGLPPGLPPDVVRELSERALVAERKLQLQRMAEENRKRPPVRVRASVQPTFVRLTFEMPPGVSVSSSLASQQFNLSFSAPLTFDLADAQVSAPANIKSIGQKIDGGTSNVVLSMIGEVDVHAFREDKNYVVDIGFEPSQKPSAKIAPKTFRAAAAEIVADKPAEPTPSLSEQIAKEVASQPPAPRDVKPDLSEVKPEAAPAAPSAVSITASKESVVEPRPAEEAAPPIAVAPPRSEPDKVFETAIPPIAVPVLAAPVIAKPLTITPSVPATAVQAKRTSDGLRLIFAFDAPTPVAVFKRSDTLWLVFDGTQPIDSSAIQGEGGSIIADVATLAMPEGQAVRVRLNRPQLASIAGDDRTLVVSLSDSAQSPSQPLMAMRNIADPTRANVSIPFSGASKLHRVNDPVAGDTLMVITAPLPPRGFMRRQNFVEFALLESTHGVVVQPNADDVMTDIGTDKIMIGRPGGLTISASKAAPDRAASIIRPVFDITQWRENAAAKFLPRLDELMTAASMANAEQALAAHVDLGRFYLARGFYQEAKGALDLALANAKPNEDIVPALIAHAVGSIMAGRPELALTDLANPLIGGNFDSQLWQALAYARQEKWSEAREKFKNMEFAITSLPVDLQRIVILDAMRAALEVKDYSGATARSNDLETIGVAPEQRANLALLRGRLAEALGREKDALTSLQQAIASDDRPAAAEATLLATALRRKRGEIDEEAALHDVELISATWRGDATEVKSLLMLSQAYAAAGRYSEAFAAWRIATMQQPNSATVRQTQDDASALFADLYLGAKGAELPPVEALAMFYDYRDLTPIGRRGDEMIRRLADRLMAVDLLDQASDLLQYQIDHRLEGAARAHVAARLAMVYLTNRKPDRAIKALRSTRISDLAGELRQQRLLLEARALSDVGRHDLAIDIISNIGGRESVRLRSDIYWAGRRWRESAEQIELLYGDRWRNFDPLNDVEKADIVRAAIGYALAEDAIGLSRLREKYGAKMEAAGDRAAFAIVSKPASATSADFAKIAKMAAGIDTLDGFLREMRTRFPDAMARAKLPADMSKADPASTGTLPAFGGLKKIEPRR